MMLNTSFNLFFAVPWKTPNLHIEQIKLAAMEAMNGQRLIRRPIIVTIHFYRNLPADSKSFGNIDALAKLVLDAMTGIVFDDVSRVAVLNAVKLPVVHDEHFIVSVVKAPPCDLQ